jgi:hypothetical protein
MTEPLVGGRRRIDRVLAEDYLDDLTGRDTDEVRSMRREAQQEEADLSYVRRMLQGRMDILRAERARRDGQGGEGTIVAHLSEVLADSVRTDRGLGRFLDVEPSRVGETRRAVEQVVSDIGISDVGSLDDDGLAAAQARLEETERSVSASRQRVQHVMDALTAEIARRYKDGAASVDDLLTGGG